MGWVVGIRQIGNQREVDVGIVIAQEADFEIFDEAANLLFVQQQRGNGDQGQAVVRNALGEIELGQNFRLQAAR